MNKLTASATQARLLGYLAAYGRKYPHAWETAERFRHDRSGLPQWPAWCYLPLNGWYSVISFHHGGRQLSPDDAQGIGPLAALGAWRYTQGIYRYHTAVFDALGDTPLSGEIPVEVIYRLPEWSLYIETPADFLCGGICGFFVFLEHDTNDNSDELRFVVDSGHDLVNGPTIHLGNWSVLRAVEIWQNEAQAANPDTAMGADTVREIADLAGRLMSIVLYLCADEPEIDGHSPGQRPVYPKYKKIKRGLALFPPDRPHVWRIGEPTGEAITTAAGAPHAAGSADKRSPRPHIRRAHWHGFWSGPIKPREGIELQPRRFGYKWIPPIAVGVGSDDE